MGGSQSTAQQVQKRLTLTDFSLERSRSALEFSKQILDFNLKEGGCPLNTAVFDEVELRNNGKKKVKFKFDPVHPTTCQLQFSPASGSIDTNKTKRIKVRLVITSRVNLNFKITLRTQGGESLFLNLRVAGETGVFGSDPAQLEQAEDGEYIVPAILVNMKKCMIAKNGINTEGIFRLAGEQTEIQRIKDAMNRKIFDYQTNDVNAIASLIKIWFRELPIPILNALPADIIMNFSDAKDCVEAFRNLEDPQKSLLSWLLDFLVQIAANSDVNKMTSQNLAIVIAPNLYDISTPNPMEGLIMSQKCAQFMHHVLSARIAGEC